LDTKRFNLPKGTDSNQFLELLHQEFPSLSKLLTISILAVNLEFVDKERPVIFQNNDEVAVIPPISGG